MFSHPLPGIIRVPLGPNSHSKHIPGAVILVNIQVLLLQNERFKLLLCLSIVVVLFFLFLPSPLSKMTLGHQLVCSLVIITNFNSEVGWLLKVSLATRRLCNRPPPLPRLKSSVRWKTFSWKLRTNGHSARKKVYLKHSKIPIVKFLCAFILRNVNYDQYRQ